jgi:hypothetical protein
MNYLTQEWTSPLLKPRLVKESVFVQSLTPDELGMIRAALGKGLKPRSFSVEGTTLILKLDREEG